MTPLTGFAPDADATLAGVITDCDGLIPFEAGMRGAPSAQDVGADALASECRGAAIVSDLTGARRAYAGTATGLYELAGGAWTDRSASVYALAADQRWNFIQYANTTIAATPTQRLQRSTGAAFSVIAGAPFAKLVEAAEGFVIAFNTSDYADEWYCSAYLDDTDWTLDVTTQCVKGRLIGGSGPLTAARRFGSDVVAYKAGALFHGRYQGPPSVWTWQQVSTDVGCIGQDAVVDTAIGHIFVGRDNVYLYDGTMPRPLATGTIRKWLFRAMSPTLAYKTQLLWDRSNGLVWIFYASGASEALDKCVVYHVFTQRWGVSNRTIEQAINYVSGQLTYSDLGGYTYETLPAVSYDSLFWVNGASQPAVFGADHKIAQLVGIADSGYFVTGDFGDDAGYTLCDNVRLRYLVQPTTSQVTGYVSDVSGGAQTAGIPRTERDGQHFIRQRGRWHRFRVATTGDFQVTGVRPNLKFAGAR